MSRKRQIEKKQETRSLILDTARAIVEAEGIDKLSIRKISKVLDYSPGNIYHYFKDKEEILETILKEGYGKILRSLSKSRVCLDNPAQELEIGFRNYIDTVLDYGKEYKAFVLSENPNILNHTKILYEGVHKQKDSMEQLYNTLERGVDMGVFNIDNIELTAQSLWVSINGLVLRLIIEEVEKNFRSKLIEEHLRLLLRSIDA